MTDATPSAAPLTCNRGPYGCGGTVFLRTSRSGCTRAPICEAHADELDRTLDAVAVRYPEVNHPRDCLCPGCSGDAH